MRARSSLAATLLFIAGVRTIEVTSNSACSATCGGGLTFGTDVTCNDDGYNNTDVGRKMDACLTCESTSTASLPSDGNDTAKNDLYWFLCKDPIKRTCSTLSEPPTNHALERTVNMKYTAQICLFTNTTDTSGMPACDTACNPLQTVLETSWFTTPMATQYNYCDIDSGSFLANADTCASCLQGKPGSVVLGNFLETMSAACSSRPNATQGQTLSLPVSLFDVDASSSSSLSSSSSSPSSTSTAGASPSSSSPSSASASSSPSSPPPSTAPSSGGQTSTTSKSTSGLSTGTSIGIGVGIGMAVLAAVAAILVWCFVRRKKKQQQQSAKAHPETFKERYEDGKQYHTTRPPTYAGAPASELSHKHSRHPEELEGTGTSDPNGRGVYGRTELASNIPPAELGTHER